MINNEIKADIFSAFITDKYDTFIQGCNCFCVQGAGVAGILSIRYPEVLSEDRKTMVGDKNKLGSFTIAKTRDGDVVNLYSQYEYGTDKMNVDYDAIRSGFSALNTTLKDRKICMVRVGAGLAGGDWNKIRDIINDVTPDIDIDVFYI